MNQVKLQSMSLDTRSAKKQTESIHHLGSESKIPLEEIDPEAASQLKALDLPLTKGNYFYLLFGDSEHEIHPEEYELLPAELRPAD